MKTCARCHQDKPLGCFKPKGDRPGQYQAYCMPCQSDYGKEHYAANKAQYIAQANGARKAKSAWFQDLKESQPCADCGNYFPYYVTQFDHLDGSRKKFNLADHHSKAKSAVLEELSKCELVCANCHAVRTHQRKHP